MIKWHPIVEGGIKPELVYTSDSYDMEFNRLKKYIEFLIKNE